MSSVRAVAAPVAGAAGQALNVAHVILPTSVVAGQTVTVAASLDTPSAGTTVEFFVNGESFGVYAAPYSFALTVPYTISSLRVTAAANGVASTPLKLLVNSPVPKLQQAMGLQVLRASSRGIQSFIASVRQRISRNR